MALKFTVIIPEDTVDKIIEYLGYENKNSFDEARRAELGEALANSTKSRIIDEPHYAAEDAESVNSSLTAN